MTDLPPGWAETTLGEIADTSLGKMLDRGKSTGEHAAPYLRNVNVQWGRIDLEDVLTMDISPEEREFFRLEPGDLLVCEGGEIGRCAIWLGCTEYVSYQKALHRVRPHNGIEVKYLRYLMERMSLEGFLGPYSTGSTIKHLPQQQLRRIPIYLPPTAEQRRMVTVLEDYLSRLEKTGEFATTISRRLANLRKTTIRTCLDLLSVNKGQKRRLGDVALIASGHTPKRVADFLNSQGDAECIPYYKVGDMNLVSDRYMGQSRTYVAHDDAAKLGLHVRPAGTVLIPKRGGAIHTNKKKIMCTPAAYDLNTMGIVPSELLDPEYLWYWLENLDLSALADGSNVPQINRPDLADLLIPVPSLARQIQIVTELDTAAAGIGRLASVPAMVRATSLRRSILTEAFVGRLVEQDPADEPASVLLERIRAERATQGPARRSRRRLGETEPEKEALF